MELSREVHNNGVTVIVMKGKMAGWNNAMSLSEEVAELLKNGARGIVLDMSSVPSIDSDVLGVVVRSFTRAGHMGCRLVLCGLSKKVLDLLEILKLLTVFDIYDTRSEALTGLRNSI